MRVLVVHQNFPGQFASLVLTWNQRPGWDVRGLGRDTAPGLPGFKALTRYKPTRAIRADQHAYLRQMEAATLHGQATARAMLRMRHSGFIPDVIVAHPGWGETLYAKDVFPDARLVHLCEWFYSADGADLGFDPEFPISFDARARVRTWNALHTLNLTNCDAAVSPTHWQKSRHPAIFHPKIRVQHEGIATHELGPDPNATVTTPSGVVLREGDADQPVITYVARNLEPYRGFHVFMRALERIRQKDSRCHAVIVGGDEVSYGQRPPSVGKEKSAPKGNWREHVLTQVKLDPTRTHFMGRVPREDYLRVLQCAYVPDLSLRAELVAAGRDGLRGADCGERYRSGEGSDAGRKEWEAGGFFDTNALPRRSSTRCTVRAPARSDARTLWQMRSGIT